MASTQTTSSASSFCGGPGSGNDLPSPVEVRASIETLQTGAPEMAKQVVMSVIVGLGLDSLRTLPLYSNAFQAAHGSARAAGVQAARPLDFSSGEFKAERQVACTERSLDMPGAPWPVLKMARTAVFMTNIAGYP
jgi:hypothetical protein